MLSEDPSERPSSSDVINSDLLPPKLEYEIMKEAIRTIVTPNTTIFSDLMQKLFLNQVRLTFLSSSPTYVRQLVG
jgi:translation initiation factor 2-alpha kinase 4